MADSDNIWETFDSLFKTVHQQERRLEELEARVVDMEHRLAEKEGGSELSTMPPPPALQSSTETAQRHA